MIAETLNLLLDIGLLILGGILCAIVYKIVYDFFIDL